MTPTGSPYVGVDFAKRLCGVSIIRSGESMENALRACCKGIKIGKILVHRYSMHQKGFACPPIAAARFPYRIGHDRCVGFRLIRRTAETLPALVYYHCYCDHDLSDIHLLPEPYIASCIST